MKRYKEELDRFALTKEEITKLKQAVRQEPIKQKKLIPLRYVSYASIGVCMLLFLFLQMPKNEVDNGNDKHIVTQQEANIKQVQPIAYDTNYGGFGVIKDFEMIGKRTGTANQIKQLPVYEYQRIYDMRKGSLIEEDPTYYRNWMMEVKHRLGIQGEIQEDDLHGFYVENDEMKLDFSESGDMKIHIKKVIHEPEINIEKVKTIAQEYESIYQKLASITQPSYDLSVNFLGTPIVNVQNKEDQVSSFHVSLQKLNNTNSYEVIITFVDKNNLTLVKAFDLLTYEEAEQRLLHGAYHYAFASGIFTQQDIIGYQLTYIGQEETSSFRPYYLPVYRFYVQKDTRLEMYDVIAVKEEGLQQLTKKTNWSYKEK